MKTKKSIPKQRNPFVQHLISKKQGAHNKSKKTIRQQDKLRLKRDFCKGSK